MVPSFCEELHSENYFEAVLINFCCYDTGTNAFETVQKISATYANSLKQLTLFIATPMKKTY